MNTLLQESQKIDTLVSNTLAKPQYYYVTLKNEEKNKVDQWYESIFFTSFLFPALVAILVILATKWFNRKKEKAEIKKLNAEVDQIKRDFQPVIISTIQAVQDKVIEDKINGLKNLLILKSKFLTWDYLDAEGDPVFPNGDAFFISVYEHFRGSMADDYINFHQEYAYLYSDKVLDVLKELFLKMEDLQEDHFQFYIEHTHNDQPTKTSIVLVKSINDLYDKSIALVRSDCLLDNDYIHDFIETYKK